MEWAIGIPVLLILLVCPLMMLGMIVGGWIIGRRAVGGHAGHSGHGMMCMGHGDGSHSRADRPLVQELKEERERLDQLIARAEREESR